MIRQDVKDFTDKANTAIVVLSARLDKLVAGSVTLSDEEKAELQKVVDALNALAVDVPA